MVLTYSEVIPLKKYILPFLFLIFIFGCQNQNSETLHSDAENIYTIFKNLKLEKEFLSDDESKEVKKFQSTYIENSKDYPSEKKLINEMERLINSYNFYKVAVGLKNKDGEEMYKQRFDQSISALDKHFNK
jgi:hypothetical protein